MNKMLTAAAVSAVTAWAVGYSAIASAEATVYGRVIAGAAFIDNDDEANNDDGDWNFGWVGNDGDVGPGSRFGFKGATDLGNGLEAGFKIERNVATGNEIGARHNLVYLSGGFGTVTLGNQDNPYMSARKWDQTNFFGGAKGYGSAYRNEGIGYSMSSGGFSLDVLASANNGNVVVGTTDATVRAITAANPLVIRPGRDIDADGNVAGTDEVAISITMQDYDGLVMEITDDAADASSDDYVHLDSGTVAQGNPALDGYNTAARDAAIAERVQSELVDMIEEEIERVNGNDVTPAVDADGNAIARVTDVDGYTPAAAVRDDSNGIDGWVIRAGYNFGAVNLDVALETNNTDATDARDNTAIGVNGVAGPVDWYLAYQTSELSNEGDADVDSIGGFLGFNMSEKDILYAYHVSHDEDATDKTVTETIFGYSRQIGPGVKFIAEYQGQDNDLDGAAGDSTSQLGLAVKLDF